MALYLRWYLSEMKVTVILPIRNEEKFINKTLKSIINQKFDGDLEIIISDGLSNDGTLEIVKKIKKSIKTLS